MAYFAVKGGQHAIKEAEKLVEYYRTNGESAILEVKQIQEQMRAAVDKVMGEGSLYDPVLSALALKQSEGDVLEASFLIRAFRSTLSRSTYSKAIDTTEMEIISRSSATFKDIPGGQYLGPTRDFSQRLLNFDLLEETDEQVNEQLNDYIKEVNLSIPDVVPTFPKMIDYLRQEGMLERGKECQEDSSEPIDDITKHAMTFPSSRATRLQTLSRGETGAMLALAYSGVRGSGKFHPTIGELRVGYIPVRIKHPYYEDEEITIGKIMVTEAEIIASIGDKKQGVKPKFSLGYGLVFGHNEVKAISMAILDRSMNTKAPSAPAEDEEFVLYHIDGIESLGFITHFKLPHYVDFQSELSRLKSIQKKGEEENDLL